MSEKPQIGRGRDRGREDHLPDHGRAVTNPPLLFFSEFSESTRCSSVGALTEVLEGDEHALGKAEQMRNAVAKGFPCARREKGESRRRRSGRLRQHASE